ncbi:MAG: TetR/AcrR family transcriptional regulator [Candidatus Omnitrophota bacterium]|jgi:AcrR family transcriptional regulator|nr:MAG: TetR/AcrR family transcriptional regulator [Candidatus Omnitrophota bacterium]
MTKTGKRDEIVRVALELIAENGFHATSMAMIADQAKVGAGTIYRYFESKDVLIRELFKEAEMKLYEALTIKSLDNLSIRDRFLFLMTTLFQYLIANPLQFKYLEQFFNSPYGVEMRRDKILENKGESGPFLKLFKEGHAQGVMKDLPLVVLFALALGPIMDMVRDHILGFFILDEEMIAKVIEACWDGIKR